MPADLPPFDLRRWAALWRRAGLSGDPATTFKDLRIAYSEPARHYHTATHIADCLEQFDAVAGAVRDPEALELALWFHDAVYDPRAADNEARSAELAAFVLDRAGAAPALVTAVGALILTTRTHEPAGLPDAPWLLDIDLAVLGRPRAEFLRYEAAIRAEYAWVGLPEYCAKRAEILARFLARPALYLTPPFQQRFETAARANLHRSVAALSSGRLPGY